jgi:hypothetical protein
VAGHAGGDRLALIDLHPVMYFAEAVAGSVVLQFDGSSVTAVNIRETGVVSDTFTIVKRVEACTVDADCDDANVCTDDTCNAGSCAYAPNTASCSDDDVCNGVEVCDGSGACKIQTAPPSCGDGNPCTVDTCDAIDGCANTPLTEATCRTAPQSQLMILDNADDTKDKLKFAWSKGDETLLPAFGEPRYDTVYTLCIFDYQSGSALERARLSVGRSAAFAPVTGKGWTFTDTEATSDGIFKIKLSSGDVGFPKIQIQAKGNEIPLPAPYSTERMFAADQKVAVGLVTSSGECWSAEFNAAVTQKNAASQFKAKH